MMRLAVNIETKKYASTSAPILQDCSFAIQPGEFFSLIGPSGCGKTTILRAISGLDMDFKGNISVDGISVNGPDVDRGIMFQESRLLPWKTVEQNVSFGFLSAGDHNERSDRLNYVFQLIGLESVRGLYPNQISGGMEKRVAFARAIVNLPRILLLDEPFSSLDPILKNKLYKEILQIHNKEKLTTLLVTHDLDEAILLSTRIAILSPTPTSISKIMSVPVDEVNNQNSLNILEFKRDLLDYIKQLYNNSIT